MIGLDTNVLVRYLAQDDPTQSPRATEMIESQLTRQNPGFISLIAMAETVWVLGRSLKLKSVEVAELIERLLEVDELVIESEQEVFAAMIALKDGQGSFADALIGALGRKAGCSHTLTFDQKALRLPGFQAV
jgi:predicted nucleic-acid-binding protein